MFPLLGFISSVTLAEYDKVIEGNKIVATYIDGNVTVSDLVQELKPLIDIQPESKGKSFLQLDKNFQENLIKTYINIKLFEKEADKAQIRDSEEFKKRIKEIEKKLVREEFYKLLTKDKITNKMIDDEYKAITSELKGMEEVKTSHILVETEERAKEIKNKINKGSNFASLAKEFSKDENSKSNSGEIPYILKGQLNPEYERKAFSLKKNEVSDPVKTEFGWHLIKMIDKRAAKIPSKEQLEESIKRKLSEEIIHKYMMDLRSKAQIQLKF